MEKLDLKKTLKSLYDAKPAPAMVRVPAMNYLMIDGSGNPNTAPAYAEAVQALYGLAYTLKFKVKKELQVEYPVMPLEGLWWAERMDLFSVDKKDDWLWTMMIVTPELVTPALLEAARAEALKKKGSGALERVRLECYEEGLSAQLMHIGPYSAEAENIQRLHEFIHAGGYRLHLKHHEIYLSDPRKSAPEKMKTIIRQPATE